MAYHFLQLLITCLINVKTYQFKTESKGDIHSSKTANIILPGLVTEYR